MVVIRIIIHVFMNVRADINLHLQIHVVTVILIVWKQLVVLVVIHGVIDVINVKPEAVLSVLRRYVILLAVLFMKTVHVVMRSAEIIMCTVVAKKLVLVRITENILRLVMVIFVLGIYLGNVFVVENYKKFG